MRPFMDPLPPAARDARNVALSPRRSVRGWVLPRSAAAPSGGTSAQLLPQLLDALAGAVRMRVQGERRLEAAQRRLRLLERIVNQPQPEQGTEMPRLQREGLLDVPDRGLPVADQEMHRRPLVPAFGELRRLLDHAI